MKLNDSQPGWLNRILVLGCRTSYRPAAFGRTLWLIKKDGEAVQLMQGKNTGLTTKIANPTEKQREIAMLMVSAGIASVR